MTAISSFGHHGVVAAAHGLMQANAEVAESRIMEKDAIIRKQAATIDAVRSLCHGVGRSGTGGMDVMADAVMRIIDG